MTNKPTIPTDTKKKSDIVHPGMMGDGTEEQKLLPRLYLDSSRKAQGFGEV